MNYQYGNAKGFDLILPYPIQSDPLFREVYEFLQTLFYPLDYIVLYYLTTPLETRTNEWEIKQRLAQNIANDLFALLDIYNVHYTEDGQPDYSELEDPADQKHYERITAVLYTDPSDPLCIDHWVNKIHQLFSIYYFNLVLPEDFDIFGEFEGDFRMLDENTAILTIIQPENLNLFTLAS